MKYRWAGAFHSSIKIALQKSVSIRLKSGNTFLLLGKQSAVMRHDLKNVIDRKCVRFVVVYPDHIISHEQRVDDRFLGSFGDCLKNRLQVELFDGLESVRFFRIPKIITRNSVGSRECHCKISAG